MAGGLGARVLSCAITTALLLGTSAVRAQVAPREPATDAPPPVADQEVDEKTGLPRYSVLTSPAIVRTVEPWSDPDPLHAPRRYGIGDYGFRAGAEYRANWLTINPLSINGSSGENASWIEHRLRVDGAVDWKETVRLVFSADMLDGTLWGDNGNFGGNPPSNAGTNVGTRNPNVTRPCIGQTGPDPLDRESYGYALCAQDSVFIRRAYAEVILPVGLLRVGRQPVNIGTGVQAADGDGRPNRFGFSRTGSVVDRILFATKPLEAFKPPSQRDKGENTGFFLAFAYDRFVTDSPQIPGQAVHQWATAVRFLAPTYGLGKDLLLSAYHAYRWDKQYGTKVNSIGGRAMSKFGAFSAGFDVAVNFGKTREISEAFNLITHDPVESQTIKQLGARAVVRFDQPWWTAYLEFDYASGDDDPQARTPLTGFLFAEDTNVGLLLFKHVLAFQSGRAAAAGVETLRRLGARSYPADQVDTRGAVTNAAVLFPQFDVRPFKNFFIRGGVLMAWAPARVIDPIASLQARDGFTIQDDLVNYVGGKPGRYYGTELDARIQWRYDEHFIFDLEGAILYPGDALRDANGNASKSSMMQARTTFVF
jgi:hypothetical protein